MNRETHHPDELRQTHCLDVLKRSWNGFPLLPRVSAAKCPGLSDSQ